jgi:mono/diheme cytochrome c family protein
MKRKNKIILAFAVVAVLVVLHSCNSHDYADGKWVYEKNCQTCHQADGQSLALLIPPLAGSDFLVKHKERIPCIIKHGLEETIVVNGQEYSGIMYGIKGISDVDITNVINYVNNSFGNKNGFTSLEQVQSYLKTCEEN